MLILTVSRMCFPFLIVDGNIIIGGLGKEINAEQLSISLKSGANVVLGSFLAYNVKNQQKY